MYKIGIISDTHGLLRPEVLEILKDCECVFHAGDIGKKEVFDKLNEIKPLYAVRGNVDKELTESIPYELSIELSGFKIYMVHNKKHIPADINADIVIFGHSHKYSEENKNGTAFLNPGSCGGRRFKLPVTMMILKLYEAEHRWEAEKIDLSPQTDSKTLEDDKIPKNADKLIDKMLKEMKSGKSSAEIAEKNGISRELSEQICRIYFTHRGIDVEGIMKRLEIKNL